MNTAIAVFLWFVIPLLLILLATKVGDKPELIIDATSAATTLCTKGPPVCDEACVRLTVTRRLT
jgi:hypothetical protein